LITLSYAMTQEIGFYFSVFTEQRELQETSAMSNNSSFASNWF